MKILEFFSKYQRFIIYSVLCLAVVALFDKALAVGVAFIIFLCAVTFLFLNKQKQQAKVLGSLFLIVFLLHILCVLFFHYTNFQPLSGGGGDYVAYHQQAREVALRVQQGNFSLGGITLFNYYPVILGYLYTFTMPSMLIGQLFNAWLVALTVIFVYLIAREIGGTEKEGFLAGIIACIYPSLAFYGSLLLKDALVVSLCMIGLLLTIKIVKSFYVLKFVGFFVVLTGLIHFRFYIGYALMFGFIISWFLIANIRIKKRIIYGIIMVFILGFSPQILDGGYYGFINLKNYLNVPKITTYREVSYAPRVEIVAPAARGQNSVVPVPSAHQNSSVIIKTGFENPITFVKNTFLQCINVFLGPFPWQLQPLKYLFVLPEMIIWYFLLFFIVRGIIK
jgi:hypothetical protein